MILWQRFVPNIGMHCLRTADLQLLYAIRGVAGYDIYNYTVFSFDKEQIYNNKRFPGLAGKSRYLTDTLVNKNTGEKIYIYDMELDSIHNYIENNCKKCIFSCIWILFIFFL